MKSLAVLVVGSFLIAAPVFGASTYKGAKTCKPCHSAPKMGGEAFKVWEKTKHAKAFETLKSKEADEIAKKKGLKTSAAESPECLKCHVTGGGTAAGVDKKEGVTCEACHGAASAYLTLHNKKDEASKTKAKEAGLVLSTDPKVCEGCHNKQSPTFKGFNYKESWAKIEHKGPAK